MQFQYYTEISKSFCMYAYGESRLEEGSVGFTRLVSSEIM
jgi:hypothetical protein